MISKFIINVSMVRILKLLSPPSVFPRMKTNVPKGVEGLKPPIADGSPLGCVRRHLRRGRRRAALLPASRHRAHLLRTTSREAAAVGIPTIPPSTPVLPAAAPAQRSAAADISSQRQVRLQEGARPPCCISSIRGRRIDPSSADNSRGRFLR